MHIVATNVQLALMVAAMCFVAAEFHGGMRVYSIVSLAISAASNRTGAGTGLAGVGTACAG